MDDLKRQWTSRFRVEFDDICFQYGAKLLAPFFLVNDSKNQLGLWDPMTRTIKISSHLILNNPWHLVTEVLKHEMAHQWVTEIFKSDKGGHGTLFRKACDALAVAPWARVAQVELQEVIRDWREESKSDDEKRLLRKVQKLMQLAGSSNENEAYLAMKKVKELYSQHTRLDSLTETSYVTSVINHEKKSIGLYQHKIASILTGHFQVEVIQSHLYHPLKLTTHKIFEILGEREKVEIAEYVYWYLFNSLHSMWKETKNSLSNTSITARNSFFYGVLDGFESKLKIEHIHVEIPKSLIKVQEKGLTEYVSHRYPRLRRSYARTSSHDYQSFDLGRRQGKSLNLRSGIQKTRSETKLLR